MAAITWRNVDGPSLEGVSNIYRAASEGMNSSLGILDRMLQNRNAIQAANWDAEKANNTEAFKTAVSAATTPEELAAMQPKLQEMAQGFDGKVDPAVLRDYASTHLKALRTQTLDTQAYADGQKAHAAKPLLNEAMARINAGDVTGALSILNSNDLGEGEVAAFDAASKMTQSLKEQSRADKMNPIKDELTVTQLRNEQTLARKTAETEEQSRIADQFLLEEQQSVANTTAERQKGLKFIAYNMGIKLDPSGNPMLEGQPVEVQEAFATQAAKMGISNGASTSANLGNLKNRLTKAGIRPDIADATLLRAQQGLSSEGMLTAQDQAAIATKNAAIEAQKTLDKTNNYAWSDPTTRLAESSRVLDIVDAKIGSNDGDSTKRGIRQSLGKMMEEGIKINGVKVPVPPKLMERALNENIETNSYIWNDTVGDVENWLIETMSTPAYKAMSDRAATWEAQDDVELQLRNIREGKAKSGGDTSASTIRSLEKLGKAASTGNQPAIKSSDLLKDLRKSK